MANAVKSKAKLDFNGMSLDLWIRNETGMTVDRYASAVLRGHWGGLLDMQLLSDELRRPFVVYILRGGSKNTLATKIMEVHPRHQEDLDGQQSCAKAGPIMLLFQGRVHYDALDFVGPQQTV